MKARKYFQKKYYPFLAHIIDRKENKKKKISEVTQVCDYPDVFSEDQPALSRTR